MTITGFSERVLKLADKILSKKRYLSSREEPGESKAHGEAEARRLWQKGMRVAGLKVEDLPRLNDCRLNDCRLKPTDSYSD